MPRKAKDVYERISTTQNKIDKYENEIKELKAKLVALNKEKDELEMNKLFDMAKENNMSIDDVVNAINLYKYGKNAK